MSTTISPSGFVMFTRDEIAARYLANTQIRAPQLDVSEGSQPWIDSQIEADMLTPVLANGATIAGGIAVQTMTGQQLDNEIQRLGSARIPATGGGGFVIAQGSSGGGTIFAGDVLKDPSGLTFQCSVTGLYRPGDSVPVIGISTGPGTNIAAGVTMIWTSPRPGINPNALVAVQPGGVGLSGGRVVESDQQLQARIILLRSNPPGAGNDAQIQDVISKAPGLPVQQGFTFPCCNGPGSIGFAFTLTPPQTGATRIPSTAQIAQVLALLIASFPGDYSFLACTIVTQQVTPAFAVTWAPGAAAWDDASPWPQYLPGAMVSVDVGGTLNPTQFRLTTTTSTANPQVGQTIGFYDQPSAMWRMKRIAAISTVSSGLSWDITVNTSFSVSDTSYTPIAGQPASPWSDSLQSTVAPVAVYFDTLGPGEQTSVFPDPNLRLKRSPPSPATWPSSITNRLDAATLALNTLQDAVLVTPTTPFAVTTGGIAAINMFALNNYAVFPQ